LGDGSWHLDRRHAGIAAGTISTNISDGLCIVR